MLKQLTIKNIILVESATIFFEPGFNALSGETGSGKSAILLALSLLFGAKADTGLIRQGAERASVEGFFESVENPMLTHLLEEAGIHFEENEGLVIKREININGKNRTFINNQAANLNLLKTIASFLGSIISQHASGWLLLTDNHRAIVDMYGGLTDERQAFSKSFSEETRLENELKHLISEEQKRFREIEIYRAEIEEIENAHLKENEDEEIFAEYTLLINAENLNAKAREIQEALEGNKTPFLTLLNKQKANFDYLLKTDGSLLETAASFQNALLELEEVSYNIRTYLSKIECNPKRAEELNERLECITKLKKKYGATLLEIETYKGEAKKKLALLETLDEKIEEMQQSLAGLKSKNDALAALLTKKRKNAAKQLEKGINLELSSLNMPKAVFEVCFNEIPKQTKGADFIEFYMTPNIGEHKIPVRESASGGELSRILLSLQSLLAEKEKTPTLIFDEIDANIGGETALIVGEKLQKLGNHSQVLCITHFPQVAKQADHHLCISKKEEAGRTFTEVLSLTTENLRLQELARMSGIRTC